MRYGSWCNDFYICDSNDNPGTDRSLCIPGRVRPGNECSSVDSCGGAGAFTDWVYHLFVSEEQLFESEMPGVRNQSEGKLCGMPRLRYKT